MVACNIKVVTFPSEWPCQMWRGTIGDAAQPMFVAIDIEAWPDMSDHHKSCDILVYDKIRWRQAERTEDLRRPLYSALEQRNLSYRVLRYGEHHIGQFRDALRHCRAMVFLCEHETQGLAYQEAMSSGVPILAWDEGELVDPHERAFAPPGLVVSSVPYFDARCGTTFTRETLQQQLEAFLGDLGTFRPREYVVDTLSPAAGVARYLNLLEQASRAK
ncbi:hypothetical protein OCH239_15235 [Roseivivax halodurans JCM 10272]|uniref:Glycosyl transferase family 1 domain-containing protein n=2 Tax=Roseivivax halodurans TaxID=93683 RepID=X7ECN5_9RHOB|nr:hypothetical protein OCH239_15235 [Roseivivax halodurans JCM 10272]